MTSTRSTGSWSRRSHGRREGLRARLKGEGHGTRFAARGSGRAAGTTALNAATYLDMAVRGRASSSAPQDLVEAVADRADVEIPGKGDERDNRLAGLGPLSGIGVGAAAGLLLSALRKHGSAPSAPIVAVLIGAAAMASSDVPLKLFRDQRPGQVGGQGPGRRRRSAPGLRLVTYAAISAWGDQ